MLEFMMNKLRGGIPPQTHDREYGRKGFTPFADAFNVNAPDVPELAGQVPPMQGPSQAPGATGSGSGTPLAPQEHPMVGGTAQGQNAPLPPPRPTDLAGKFDPFAPAYRTGNDESAWVDPRAFGPQGNTPLGQGPGKPGDGVNAFVGSGAPQAFQQPQVAAATPPVAPTAPRVMSPSELPSRDLLNKDGGPTNPQAAGFNPIGKDSPVANLMKLFNRGFA